MRGTWPNIRRVNRTLSVLLVVLVLLSMVGAQQAHAQNEEPTPILVTIVAPEQAEPGSLMDMLVQYELVDPNAGANLNYNVRGPCHIVERNPEPPNPIVNTWVPGRGLATKGAIQMRLQIDPQSDGQVITHQVEVRWGAKARVFAAQTRVVYVPPTPTPTATPRPRVTPTLAAPGPTAVPMPTFSLTGVTVLDADGVPVSAVEANQLIALRIGYSSTSDVADLQVAIRFQPDVVNVESLQRSPEGYTVRGLVLPATTAGVVDLPIQGRIRPYLEQEGEYELRVTVELLSTANPPLALPVIAASGVVQVTQPLLVDVQARLEASTVRAGGSLIVRVACQNHGTVPVGPVRLSLAGLPTGFAVSPAEQVVDRLADRGDADERLFTVHTSESYQGPLHFTAIANVGDTVIESPHVTAEALASMRLVLEVSADRPTVQSGGSLNLTVHITNPGALEAQGVTARVLDVAQILSAAEQEVGSLPPLASRDIVFAIDVPPDLPSNIASTLIAQVTSGDGTVSQSDPLTVPVICRPRYEVLVQPLVGDLRSGQSIEVRCLVRNTSQCTARELFATVANLPLEFASPAAQKITELMPGGTRQLVFSLLVPSGFVGEASFEVAVSDGGGNSARSQAVSLTVSSLSTLSFVAFGLLVLLALAMVVGGVALYVRGR